MMSRIGVVLMNLGSPQDTTRKSIRKYLKEFLSDPRVLDIPRIARWFLINGIILPFRTPKTQEAYQKIWLPDGSPLIKNTILLKEKIQQNLGEEYVVEHCMRYGDPTPSDIISKLQAQDCEKIVLVPLYPQYAASSTGTAIEHFNTAINSKWNTPYTSTLPAFHSEKGFIQSLASSYKDYFKAKQSADFLLFSYHGLPERHIAKSESGKMLCEGEKPCPGLNASNRNCYRAQCYATTDLVAKSLNLPSDQYGVSFQSRLGRTPWIKPYTDLVFEKLYLRGIRNLAVICPSFTADCLETLEEINIQGRQQWQALGGKSFHYIPCLNDRDDWAKVLAQLIIKPKDLFIKST